MKHRIHISLFSLYIGSLAIHAADIPDDYDKIEINTTNDINNYNNNTANDYYAFIISSDLIFKPTTNPNWTASKALFNGGELLFTSPPQTDPYALSFSDGKTNAFNSPTHLNFDTLSSLTFSNNVKGNGVAECYGGAVYMGDSGKLNICNVNNQADNEDVIFSSNSVSTATRNTSSYARGGAIYSKARITINNNADVIFKNKAAQVFFCKIPVIGAKFVCGLG